MVRPPKPAADADAGAAEPIPDWAPISGAALKKNKKLFDAHWKKVKKAEENKEALDKAEREREEREVKRREEASRIVLKEDESLGRAGKVSLGVFEIVWMAPCVMAKPNTTFRPARSLGQDRSPRSTSRPTRPCLWLGPSSASTSSNDVHHPP
jgi:hypothetical protein